MISRITLRFTAISFLKISAGPRIAVSLMGQQKLPSERFAA
jgi:hypothetical protein